MTESMIERVARGMHEDLLKRDPEQAGWDKLHPIFKEEGRLLARAAIEAMREPTEAALDAGFHKADEIGFLSNNEDAKEVLQAILDAALSEKP